MATNKMEVYHLSLWLIFSVSVSQAEQLMKRIGVEGVKLTEYEMNIASHLVDPHTMKVEFFGPEIIA